MTLVFNYANDRYGYRIRLLQFVDFCFAERDTYLMVFFLD